MSVRKAFLELDHDKDGLIEASDILRYFGDDDDIDLVDLTTLMRERRKTTSESDAKGAKLNCHDFTNWLGESIHQREGFYFRHDSVINQKFVANQKKREEEMKLNEEGIKKVFFGDLEKVMGEVLDKFAQQWATLNSAFKALCTSEKGYVHTYDLQHLLEHWGFHLTAQQF